MDASNIRSRQFWFVLVTLLCLLVGTVTVSAQASPTPITAGENLLGSITDPNGAVSYSLSVASPMSVEIQVLAITPGFAPTFVILDPGGTVILDAANPGTQAVAQGTPNLYSLGAYTIEVSSANGTAGQFLISVQAGEPLARPLTVGENQIGAISDVGSSVQYELSVAVPQSVDLQVLAITVGLAPRLRVVDSDDSLIFEDVNAAGQSIARGIIDLPAAGTYRVDVGSANNTTGQYLISPQPGEIVASPTASPTTETGSACIATIYGWYVLHEGPGTQYPTIEVGNETTAPTALVLGYFPLPPPDWDWYKVFINSKVGWLSEPTFSLGENCASIPLLEAPPSPTPSPTIPPLPTSTPIPGLNVTLQSGDFGGTCQVQSAGGASINVRGGPGTGYGVVDNLPPGIVAPVIGRLADNSWFQVNLGIVIGWVSASVVALSGDCTGIGIVAPPPPPQVTAVIVPIQPGNPTPTPTPIVQITAVTAPIRPDNPTVTPNPLLQITPIGRTGRTALPDLSGDLQGLFFDSVRVHIVNGGSADAGGFSVSVCVISLPPDADVTCRTTPVSSLAAGGETVVLVAFPDTLTGQHPVTLTVDSISQIAESNENNNTTNGTLNFS